MRALPLLLLLPVASAAVPLAPPFAEFVWSPTLLFAEDEVEFHSLATDPDGIVVLFEWDVPGREAALLPLERTAEHAFPRRGEYVVTHTVTDSTGMSASISRAVLVANSPPVAAIRWDATPVHRGVPVTFEANASDADGDAIVDRSWTFADGQAAGASVTRTFWTLGEHEVSLAVTDELGDTGFTSAIVRVVNRPPVVTGHFTPHAPEVGEPVTFVAEGVDPDAPGGSVTFAWAFSDGLVLEGANVTRTFDQAGDRSVTLRGTDAEGASSAPFLLAISVSG